MSHKLLIMITTYARGFNLPAVVESVVSQSFKDYKIVICDDCSPEDPTEIINDIKNKYPNVDIEHHRNSKNIGEGMNIAYTLGREWDNGFKYCVLLQDDTVYLDSTFLSKGIQLLEENPDARYCAGIISTENRNKPLINPQDRIAIRLSGIDFWRLWGSIGTQWAACIFYYDDLFQYYMSSKRRDCINADSLFLLRNALKGNVIIYNRISLEQAYNKTGQGYERYYKDPIDRFIKVEKYYKLVSLDAIEHGVSKAEANQWLLNHQLALAMAAINRIGKDEALMNKFMMTLLDYDKELAVSLLLNILKTVIH